jgi:hypothetical protein
LAALIPRAANAYRSEKDISLLQPRYREDQVLLTGGFASLPHGRFALTRQKLSIEALAVNDFTSNSVTWFTCVANPQLA